MILYKFGACIGVKGKAIPLQAWTSPEGSRRMKLPDEGGKVVSPKQRPPLPPQEIFLVLISIEAESTPGP